MVPADELRAIERRRLQALVCGDRAAAEPLHADDYQLVSPSGRTYTKDEYLDAVVSKQLEYRVFEPVGDIAVRGDDQVAVLRYVCRIAFRTDDGDAAPFECWHTDVYERRSGTWQAVWSQATRRSS